MNGMFFCCAHFLHWSNPYMMYSILVCMFHVIFPAGGLLLMDSASWHAFSPSPCTSGIHKRGQSGCPWLPCRQIEASINGLCVCESHYRDHAGLLKRTAAAPNNSQPTLQLVSANTSVCCVFNNAWDQVCASLSSCLLLSKLKLLCLLNDAQFHTHTHFKSYLINQNQWAAQQNRFRLDR